MGLVGYVGGWWVLMGWVKGWWEGLWADGRGYMLVGGVRG